MPVIARAYYDATFEDFSSSSDEEVLGRLSRSSELGLEQSQRGAWLEEFGILRDALQGADGYLLLEYAIPRMGRRVDAVLLLPRSVIVVEFKAGATEYAPSALDQVTDYALDLKNFQKQSHDKFVVPLLVATEGPAKQLTLVRHTDGLFDPVCANRHSFGSALARIALDVLGPAVNRSTWLESVYCPTPTIVEAAQTLYQKHSIAEISRSEAGAENLTRTAEAITGIVKESRASGKKSICFVTGVPGAGKTLAGLNIANSWHSPENNDHAVFLSGNGPLVEVLREALARDDVERAKAAGRPLTKATALSKVKAFIQNVHHFRDDSLATAAPPIEGIAVFDEAQRAWDKAQTDSFMRRRKGVANFDKSEPDFLISVMDRHSGWATIVCLIGGGQEINTGEAGLAEWFAVLRRSYPDWLVYVPDSIADSEYSDVLTPEVLGGIPHLEHRSGLHLSTSIRSFRAEKVSDFVKALLDCESDKASATLDEILLAYPIRLTRDVDSAKSWLRQQARGTERFGIVASSEAQRLRPFGIDVKAEIDPTNWFLNDKNDIRSSFYLEDVATEFQVQGLELDWVCVAWDGDLRFNDGGWEYHCFLGTRWLTIKSPERRKYLKNAYRVLLTRARQGMVLFVPEGSSEDQTRRRIYYDQTYEYLKSLGIPELTSVDRPGI
jgi:hypothetical protein